jgi:glycerol kinase
MRQKHNAILAFDQGTTSSRAILFSVDGVVLGVSQKEFEQIFPADGWVEHRAADIWESVLDVGREMVAKAVSLNLTIIAAGIANQRETTLVWDRKTGEVVYNAIVWQDRRTSKHCKALSDEGSLDNVRQATGLLLDPYFSATKIAWILDNVSGLRSRAERGELCFGTVDSFLIWKMTGGLKHVTDATNASRTSLYNIRKGMWDPDLCQLFNVPMAMLADVKDSAGYFGDCPAKIFGQAFPICGVAGDQHAATIGQACFTKGSIKSTYGTGCFMLANTGQDCLLSDNNLLSTIAYQINGQVTYGLEGSIFISGAVIQWLRDGMGLLSGAAESEILATSLSNNEGVYMVPALAGLGAPHWSPSARGAIFGLTRNTGPAHFVRAALESVAFQTYDLIQAMRADGIEPKGLRVDGGMVDNNFLMQFLSDILDLQVEKPVMTETTALGAALLAMLGSGQINTLDDTAKLWQLETPFQPHLDISKRDALLAGWQTAVKRTLLDCN